MECIKANAVLLGNRIVVLDVKEGHDLYFRGGFYGRFFTVPKPKLPDVEKELEISLFDAMYLLEQGCLNLTNERGEPIKPSEFFSIASKLYDNFYDAYTVYKDLRNRGYVVKSGMKFGSTFAVYQFGPGIDHSIFLVEVLKYGDKLDPIQIIRAGRLSHSVRKRFILAYRDPATNRIQYFSFKWLM
ncbi:MAG: tRNA-intron lyase [Thermofilum sp.]|nr:tRNA-intron lyase [Thermofilum sp.]